MRRKQYLATLSAFLVVNLCVVHAQQPIGSEIVERKLVPFSIALQAKGIISRDDIIAGLRNTDPDIRRLCAMRLAELKDPQAKALINDALQAEETDRVKVDFASSLWALGDTRGQSLLSAQCASKETQPAVVAAAVHQLSLRGTGAGCYERLTELISASASTRDRLLGLIALTAIQATFSPPEQTRLVDLVDTILRDPTDDQESRVVSVELLAAVGGDRAKKTLHDAMQVDANNALKVYIQHVVDRLESQPTLMSHKVQPAQSTNATPNLVVSPFCTDPTSPICPTYVNTAGSGSIHTVTLSGTTNPSLAPPYIKSGVGIDVTMTVTDPTNPSANFDGAIVSETIQQISASGNCGRIHLCRNQAGVASWWVGQDSGQDPYDGYTYPALTNTFYDVHKYSNAYDILGYYGWGSCSAVCKQQYTCNGTVIGGSSFSIDFSLSPDTVNGYSVTHVAVGYYKN